MGRELDPENESGRGVERVSIFCDFDGTLTASDIGYNLFATFGSQEPLHSMLIAGELPIREYWRRVVGTLQEEMTQERLDEYLLGIPPDRGTDELFNLIRRTGVHFTLLSDGMNLYIDRWLELHRFDAPEMYCNHARLDQEGKISIDFPWSCEECTCLSAVCKRNLVLDQTPPDFRIIYIGDGMSDFCPAELADVVFAKGALAAYCNENSIPHHSFRTIAEVVPILEKKLNARRIRKRKRAENARKRAWGEG